jgi:hypothetical protein
VSHRRTVGYCRHFWSPTMRFWIHSHELHPLDLNYVFRGAIFLYTHPWSAEHLNFLLPVPPRLFTEECTGFGEFEFEFEFGVISNFDTAVALLTTCYEVQCEVKLKAQYTWYLLRQYTSEDNWNSIIAILSIWGWGTGTRKYLDILSKI